MDGGIELNESRVCYFPRPLSLPEEREVSYDSWSSDSSVIYGVLTPFPPLMVPDDVILYCCVR